MSPAATLIFNAGLRTSIVQRTLNLLLRHIEIAATTLSIKIMFGFDFPSDAAEHRSRNWIERTSV